LLKYSKVISFFNGIINYAIGFRNIGIYIAKYDSINPANTIFEKKVVTADNELIESEINNGFHLKNGKFVITSNKKGAYIINKNLEITERLNNKSGLFENNIKAAYEDKNGNLWLPNYYGISYVEINSSLLKYGRETGISGSVQASCYYNNNLYIGTDKGLQIYDLKTQAFTDVLNFNKQTWFLLNYSNLLFVCTLDGIYIFNGKEIKQISEESTNYLLNDPYQTNIVYAATDKGANVYHLFGSELSLIKSYDLGNEVKSIASDKNKNIYFSTPSNGIYYLNYQNSYLIDSLQKKRGLPNDKHENFVFNYNNNLLIGTDDGIYSVYKGRQNKLFCKKDSIFFRSTKNAEVYRAVNLGRDLLCSKKNKLEDADKYEYNYSFYKFLGNKLIEDNASLIKLKDVKPNLISYDTLNKVALISADEGLFIFNPQNNNIHKTYNLFLSSLINNKSDTLAVHQIYSADFKDCI